MSDPFDLFFQVASITGFLASLWLVELGKLRLWGATFSGFSFALLAALPLAENEFHALRLLSWVLFVHVPLSLVVYAVLHFNERKHFCVALGIALVLTAIGVDAFFIEPHALQTTHYRISVSGGEKRIRIAVLADIQTDEVGEYERSVFERVRELEPDLVLLPGDFLQVYDSRRANEEKKLRELLETLTPALGSFAVQGNIDPPIVAHLFRGTSVQYWARTRSVRLTNQISLVGLSKHDSFDGNLRLPPGESPLQIVFGHAPDFSLASRDENYTQLFIAGHTHGGQVRLPFVGPLLTHSQVPRPWAAGSRIELGPKRTLIVSRGIGMERNRAPRLRFLCPPEIVIIDVDNEIPTSRGSDRLSDRPKSKR